MHMSERPDDTARLDVIFNDTCPICSREVAMYEARTDDSVAYHGLSTADLPAFGLDAERAAREFHVMRDGRPYNGVEAFALLWERMPSTRWLAKVIRWPVTRTISGIVYRKVLAPLLFAMHKRRQARRGATPGAPSRNSQP